MDKLHTKLLLESSFDRRGFLRERLGRAFNAGEHFFFRGRRGDLVKVLWQDGVGMAPYVKRLEPGKFNWTTNQSGEEVPISAVQLPELPSWAWNDTASVVRFA